MGAILKKWNSLSKPAKASLAFVFSSFIIKGISFVSTPIFTRLMDTTQYGVISTYNSWISIIDVFACLGLTSVGIINVGLNENKSSKAEYMSSMLGLCNINTILVFSVLYIIQRTFRPINISNSLLLLMFIHLLFNPAQIFWITKERYEYNYRIPTIITVLSALLGQVISMIAVILSNSELGTVKLWYSELGMAVFYIPIYIHIIFRGKKIFNFSLWQTTIIFALPLLPHYLSNHIMASADRIMVADIVSVADAGIYSVASTVSSVATIFWNAINASFMPYTFESINNKNTSSINEIAILLIIGYTVICICVSLIAPEIMGILAPPEYKNGVFVIPPILAVAFLNAVYNLFSNVEFYYKKTKIIASATIISAIVNIILNLILIPRYGYIGAAYTTLISTIVMALMHYVGYKTTSINLYNTNNILAVSVICILMCVLCNFLYFNINLRYTLLSIIICIAILKYKKIINVLRAIKNK